MGHNGIGGNHNSIVLSQDMCSPSSQIKEKPFLETTKGRKWCFESMKNDIFKRDDDCVVLCKTCPEEGLRGRI